MDIAKEISILLNSLDMYKQTREEMIKNHIDYSKIDLINREITTIEESIKELSTKLCDNNKQCTCDGIKEGCSSEKCKSRYYSNLEIALQEQKVDNANKCEKNVSYYPTNEKVPMVEEKKHCRRIENDNSLAINANKMLEELSTYHLVQNNRFLVHFGEDYGIKPAMISTVYNCEKDNDISITIREFCNDNFILPIVLQEIVNEKPQSFDFSIDILDSYNKVLYTKKYIHCQIKSIIEPSMTYTCDSCNRYNVIITYSRCDIRKAKENKVKTMGNETSYSTERPKEYAKNVFKGTQKFK